MPLQTGGGRGEGHIAVVVKKDGEERMMRETEK